MKTCSKCHSGWRDLSRSQKNGEKSMRSIHMPKVTVVRLTEDRWILNLEELWLSENLRSESLKAGFCSFRESSHWPWPHRWKERGHSEKSHVSMPLFVPLPRKAKPSSNFQCNLRRWSGVCTVDLWRHWHLKERFYPLTTFSIPFPDQVLML